MRMASRGLALMIGANGAEAGQPALLERARAGDLPAFEEIIIQHERQVFLTALRLLGRPEDAQDASQEVFLRLYRHLSRFREAGALRPWLYRVTVNVCRDLYRKRQAAALVSLDDAESVAGEWPDPHSAASQAERRELVARGLARLSQKERTALVLRDFEGLSTKEVARILGSREGTVRVQISSARLKLKKFAERFWKRPL